MNHYHDQPPQDSQPWREPISRLADEYKNSTAREMAEARGIKPSTMRHRLQKHGIQKPPTTDFVPGAGNAVEVRRPEPVKPQAPPPPPVLSFAADGQVTITRALMALVPALRDGCAIDLVPTTKKSDARGTWYLDLRPGTVRPVIRSLTVNENGCGLFRPSCALAARFFRNPITKEVGKRLYLRLDLSASAPDGYYALAYFTHT